MGRSDVCGTLGLALERFELQREVQPALALLLECLDRERCLVALDLADPGRLGGVFRDPLAGRLDRHRLEGAAKHIRRLGVAVTARRRERDAQLILAAITANFVRDRVDRAVALEVGLTRFLLVDVLEQVAAVSRVLVRHGGTCRAHPWPKCSLTGRRYRPALVPAAAAAARYRTDRASRASRRGSAGSCRSGRTTRTGRAQIGSSRPAPGRPAAAVVVAAAAG